MDDKAFESFVKDTVEKFDTEIKMWTDTILTGDIPFEMYKSYTGHLQGLKEARTIFVQTYKTYFEDPYA